MQTVPAFESTAIIGPVVILFGAGASYGAGGTVPEQPPLGDQLFRILEKNYPGSWGRVPEEIRRTFYRDFEAGMQLVYDRFAEAIPSLMREMAVYFIPFRPHAKSTLYCRIIRDLAANGILSRAVFSTLNYECVLEFSLLEHGYRVNYFSDNRDNGVPVWKIHGLATCSPTVFKLDPVSPMGTE